MIIIDKEYFFIDCEFENNLKLWAKLSPIINEKFDFILKENKIIIIPIKLINNFLDIKSLYPNKAK